MHEKALFNAWVSFDPLDFERSPKKTVLDAEQALMLAVLRNTVQDFQEHVHAQSAIQKKLFHEAEEWILEKDSDWFFSFENICEALQLQPGYIRQGLLSWKEAKRLAAIRQHETGATAQTKRNRLSRLTSRRRRFVISRYPRQNISTHRQTRKQ